MKISPASRLEGSVQLPPDKSIAHRAALFAAISDEISTISNYSLAADPQSTLHCLQQLGVEIHQNGTQVTVKGVGRKGFITPAKPLDCGNSGTTLRLLTGIVAGSGVEATFIGDESLSSRPMKRILNPLAEMGAQFTAREDNFLPFTSHKNNGLKAISYTLPVASAQVKSCVLLAGLFCNNETEVIEKTGTRDHTERLLNLRKDESPSGTHLFSNIEVPIPAQNYAVPGDFSAASFWMVAASILPDSHIVIPNVGMNKSRIAALHILRRMGADILIKNEKSVGGSEPVVDMEVRFAPLNATVIEADEIPNCIDELPILSIAMSFAEGKSTFSNAEELRLKECDRIHAVSEMLKKAGVTFTEHQDGLEIIGNPQLKVNSATYETWHDHRIAMSAAILSLRAKAESEILNADAAKVSYPNFYNDLRTLSK